VAGLVRPQELAVGNYLAVEMLARAGPRPLVRIEQGADMKALSRGLTTLSLFLISALLTSAQEVEFSADMRVSSGTGQTQTLKLFVGNMKARFDLPNQGTDSSGIGAILIDFDHQFIFLLIRQAKLYLQIEGSAGTPFYNGAWMFRPYSPKYPCNDWVPEPDRRGITLGCKSAGQDILDGRQTERWDATTPEGGYGSLWYDPQLNFITKVSRTSKSDVQSGYELQNAKQEPLPPNLFEVPNGFRKFTLTRFADRLAGLGQWYQHSKSARALRL
jgi:hypothetical protein